MQVRLKVSENVWVEANGDTQTDVFEQLSSMQEVFGSTTCGKCKSTDVQFVVRDVDENKYFELRCKKCFARLSFGQHKKGGGLFPKRKDGDKYLPDGGWLKWNKEKQVNE